jgi:hypothetical protein
MNGACSKTVRVSAQSISFGTGSIAKRAGQLKAGGIEKN